MEEIKLENEIKLCEVKKENLRRTMEKIKSQASDVLILNLQWCDIEDHLKSTEDKVEIRFKEVVLKEVELESKSFALEERVKVVEAEEAMVSDLEVKANGFRSEIEETRLELGFVRKSLDECSVEERSKRSQVNEIVELLRKTQVEFDLKREELGQVESDLERYRVEVNAEKELLCRTESGRRELEEEIERKSKDLSLVVCKIGECEKLLETQSLELSKTEGEVESKGKQLEQMNIDLERYRVEVIAEKELLGRTENGRRELEEEIERKSKDLSLVVDKIAECEKLFETRSSELIKIQGEVQLKGKELEQMNIDLERHRGEVRAEMEHLGRSRIWNIELGEEIEKKSKDLSLVVGKIAECEKQLKSVEEKLDSQQKLLETRSSELVSKKRELDGVNLDLDLRQQAVNSLGNEMESKAKELKEIERLIEESKAHSESIKSLLQEHTEELASKEKIHNEITEAIRKLSVEIVVEEKTLKRAKECIQKLSEKKRSIQEKVEATDRRLERSTKDYDSKKKELRTVKDTLTECVKELKIKQREFDSLQSLITERNKQVEEGEKKKQHLDNTSEELTRQLQVKQEEVCSINKAIRQCSDELKSKTKHLDQVQSLISNLTAELKSKECDLKSIKKKIQDSLKDFQSKEEQQVMLKASLVEREQELELKEKQFDARSKKIELKEKELDVREERIEKKDQLLKSTKQKLDKCVTDYELKAKKLASFCQQGKSDQNVDLVRDACVSDEKTLQLLLRGHVMKCHQLHLDVLHALKGSSDPAKLVLDTIQGLHQRMEVTKVDPNSVRRSSICLLECLMDISPEPKTEVQGEAIKFATEWKNTTLVKAENPVEVLGFLHFLAAFSLAYTFDTAKVQNLFDVAFLRKYAPSLCKALGVSSLAPVNNVLSLDDKPEQQPPEAPISNNSDSHSPDVQENIASSHLANEDAILEPEGSSSFSPNEVFTGLQVMEDPGRYVLNTVSDALTCAQQRRELGLAEPMVKNLVALLEELPRVVEPSKNLHLLSYALQVANRWSLQMGTSAQMSPLEAWGFLQLIVSYGLVHRTNRDSTLRFVSYVAHFKKAPKLFESLGLSFAIPDLVRQLLNKRLHILAIRFIISFNLNYNVSPRDFLKEEIINLRRAAKEKRIFDSQAEDKDAAKLRDIIELIEDFKLEIDLPAELILKFMVPRETQNQNQYVVSSCVPVQPLQVRMQASHTVIHSSYIATQSANPTIPTSLGASLNQQVLDLETYQTGGSTALQAQSSRQAGFKRPRIDTSASRAVIRPCFNPSSYGRS